MKAPGAHKICQGFQDTATHSPCPLFLPIPKPHPSPAWLYIAFTVIKSVLQSKILQTAHWDQPLPFQTLYRLFTVCKTHTVIPYWSISYMSIQYIGFLWPFLAECKRDQISVWDPVTCWWDAPYWLNEWTGKYVTWSFQKKYASPLSQSGGACSVRTR